MDFEVLEKSIQKRLDKKPIKKFPVKDLDEEVLPTLYWEGGMLVDAEVVRLCFHLAKEQGDERAPLLVDINQFLRREDAEQMAFYLFEKFQELGAKATHKYFLALSILFGQEKVLPTFIMYFYDLIKGRRRAVAIYLLKHLAYQKNHTVWSFLYELKLQFHLQKVGDLAAYFLETVAKEQAIDLEAWYDTLLPDFGNDAPFSTVRVGDERWKIMLDLDLKIIYSGPTGTSTQRMPRKLHEDDKFIIKYLNKRIQSGKKYYARHLHTALLCQRRWPVPTWNAVFLKNPIWSVYAQQLVWGYFEDGKLQQPFIADEEGCLIDTDFEEYVFESGEIGLVHSSYLTDAQRDDWKAFLYDGEIEQPFLQIERGVAQLPAKYAMKTKIDWYADKNTFLNSEEIKNYLGKQGWVPAEGGGGNIIFEKIFPSLNLDVVLLIRGINAWYEPRTAVMEEVLFAINKRKSTRPIKELPPIIISEILLDLEAIMGQM